MKTWRASRWSWSQTVRSKTALASSIKALGTRVVSHARNLGIDAYGVGTARQRKTQCGRLAKINKRMPKVKSCRKYGAITIKIAKAGLIPSGLHGMRCVGMPPTRVKAFRTTIGRCLLGKHGGRSLTWPLAIRECDPIHACRVEPTVARAEAVWDEQLDDAELHKAWRRQQRLVGLKPLWSTVSGPTGAIIMCLRQLRWTWPHHTTFLAASGHEGDLRETCPVDVMAQARVDSDLELWKEEADNDQQEEPQEAPVIRAALGVIHAGWWGARCREQGRSIRILALLEMRASSFGLSKASIVGLPSLS